MFGRQIILVLHIQISFLFFLPQSYSQIEVNREYYKDGRLKSEKYWRDSKETGVWKSYYETGVLKEEIDKISGRVKEYYKDGKLKTERFFNKDKTRKIIKHYFENGKIMSIGFFLNKSPLTGIEKHYNENGDLIYKYKYRNGKIVSIQKR